jgi:hypothetical protein
MPTKTIEQHFGHNCGRVANGSGHCREAIPAIVAIGNQTDPMLFLQRIFILQIIIL